MASLIPPVILKATQRHTASLIFLHGLGDNGMGWAGGLNIVRPPHVKVICPTAPIIPVAINAGAKMPAWFDVYSLDRESSDGADIEGLEASSKYLKGLVDMETQQHGIPKNRIMIGGFSQGGTVALHALLGDHDPYAGCLALSTFIRRVALPEATVDAEGEDPAKKLKTPVFQVHGTWDEVIELKWGQETRDILKSRLAEVEYHEMDGMGHEANQQELDLLKQFIEKRLPNS